jgi:hypothetical protein
MMPLNPTVLAAIITTGGAVITAFLVWWARRVDRSTSVQSEWQKTLESALTRQEDELKSLRAESAQHTRRLVALEGALRDRDELIDDMVPVVVWVQNGARPPIPSLSWRILQHLQNMRSRPSTDPLPTTKPPPDTGSSE